LTPRIFRERDRALKDDEPELAHFIEASVTAEQARVRRQKWQFRGAIAASFVFLVVAVGAVWFYLVAEEQTELARRRQSEAEEQARVAQSQELALQSERSFDEAFDVSILLAVAAAQVEDTVSARRALIKGLRAHPHLAALMFPEAGFSASGDSLAFSPDGSLLAASGPRYPVVLWDVASRKSLSSPLVAEDIDKIEILDFSADGRFLAAGDEDGVVRIWNTASRKALGRALEHRHAVKALAFSPGGYRLAGAACTNPQCSENSNGEVRIWDLQNFDELPSSPLVDPSAAIQSVAFSRSGRVLASGGSNGTVVIWDWETGTPRNRIDVGDSAVSFLQFASDGLDFMAGNEEGVFGRWRAPSSEPLVEPDVLSRSPDIQLFPQSERNAIRFSNLRLPDGVPFAHELGGGLWAIHGDLMANAHRGAIALWRPSYSTVSRLEAGIAADQVRFAFPFGWQDGAETYAVAPDGATLAVAKPDATVSLRRTDGTEVTPPWETGIDEISTMAFSSEGGLLAIGGCAEMTRPDGVARRRGEDPRCLRSRISVWDVETQERVGPPFEDHDAALLTMLFDPNDDTLVSLGSDGSRISRNLQIDAVRREEPVGEALELRFFSVGGDELRVVASEGSPLTGPTRVLLWERPFDMEHAPRIWRRRGAVSSLAVHPTDGSVMIGGHGGWIERWRPTPEDVGLSPLEAELAFEKSETYEVSRWL
jgi:WD40 repeat protein